MKPLATWLRDANRLDELAFCQRYPHPLLVHATTGYQLQTVRDVVMTMDRAVLAPARRPDAPPSAIDDYVAFEVAAVDGRRTFELSVGCDPDCDIHIDDVTVSKLHAHLTCDRHGNWYVQDASSTTGTHVNDRDPSATQVLVSGDRISFGMVDTVFYLPSQVFQLVRRLV